MTEGPALSKGKLEYEITVSCLLKPRTVFSAQSNTGFKLVMNHLCSSDAQRLVCVQWVKLHKKKTDYTEYEQVPPKNNKLCQLLLFSLAQN